MDQPTRAKWKAFVAPTLAVVIIVAGLFVVPNLAPKAETPPVAEPAPAVTQPVEQPAPEPAAPADPAPTEAPEPEPTETAEALPTLAEALRDAYPGIAFFEGTWGDYTPATDDRVGQPGVYAGIVGITGSGPKTVKFDGGTAVITPGRFDGFKNTTELLIEVR